MGLFGSKKKEEPPMQDFSMPPPGMPGSMGPSMQDMGMGGPQGMPGGPNVVDSIMSMRQQGYTNDQIIQNLQSQGVNAQTIFDSLNQADQSGPQQQQQMPAMQFPQMQPMMPMQQSYGGGEDMGREKIEQIAEAIIEEKWNSLVKDLNKIIEWKNNSEKEIAIVKQEIKDMKERLESLNQGVLGKISEYDQNLADVGTEIKAMEKVFQKILPTFTENVNRLSRITDNVSRTKVFGPVK